jgi:UDP-2,3-diacylglucosamine pyrophosphatase LpxH
VVLSVTVQKIRNRLRRSSPPPAPRNAWLGRFVRTLGLLLALALSAFAGRWLFLWLRRVPLQPTLYRTPPLLDADITPQMRRIIVSDLHFGAADRLDDFTSDAEFCAFIDHYVISTEPTELILAGDTFELLQVQCPDVDDDEWSNYAAGQRIAVVVAAHPEVFAALRRFLARPDNQLTILIGNHDFELHYPAAQAQVAAALALAVDDPRLRFALFYHGGGIYLVHGNQYDGWNRFVHFEGITEPFEVVRGTQLVKEVINELENDPLAIAPLIDNVKPTSAFLWYLLALPRLRDRATRSFTIRGISGFIQIVIWPTPHHMPITGEGPGGLLSAPPLLWIWALIARFRRGRVGRHQEVSRQLGEVAGTVNPPDPVIEQVRSEAVRQVDREVRAFNDRYAREMLSLARSPEHAADTLFVCGHTHMARVVPLGNAQTYINTGSWTEIVFDVATMRRQDQRCPFLEIHYPEGERPVGQLLVWTAPDEPPQHWQAGPTPRRRRTRRDRV